MPVSSTAAANAYAAASRALAKPQQTPKAGEGAEFGDLVKQVVSQVNQSGAAHDAKIADMAAGRADIADVVTAVAETEVALETMVAVRDRIIRAYEEVLNMPI